MAGDIKTIGDYDEITDFDPEDSLLVWVDDTGVTRRVKRKNLFNNADNIGVGTNTPHPNMALDVYRASTQTTIRAKSDNSYAALILDSAADNDAFIRFYEAGNSKGIIGVDGSDGDKLKLGTGPWVSPSALPTSGITIDSSNNVTIGAVLTVTGVPVFNAGFGNWTALSPGTEYTNRGGGYVALSYRKIGDMVMLRGELSATSDGAYLLCTLPASFRPATKHTFIVARTSVGVSYAAVYVNTNGVVELTSGGSGETAGNIISLTGICFATN